MCIADRSGRLDRIRAGRGDHPAGPRPLILLDHSESHLYQIDFDLSSVPGGQVRSPVLGDAGDGALLTVLFEERKPEVVIHAAAFKQVPLMESNPIAASQNNAIGTNLLAQAAQRYEVATFVMLSTDKAVNPRSGIGCGRYFAPIHRQPAYRPAYGPGADLRVTEFEASRCLALPFFNRLSDEQIGEVCEDLGALLPLAGSRATAETPANSAAGFLAGNSSH